MRALPVEDKSAENLKKFIGRTISVTTLKDPDEKKGCDLLETFKLTEVSTEEPLNYNEEEWRFICWVNGASLKKKLPIFAKTKIWVYAR